MKNLLFTAAFLLVLWCTSNSVHAQGITKTADAFPEAPAGTKKVIIELPEKKNSKDLKVEIFTGKSVETDACNRHFLTGQIEEKNLEGYGYTYYNYNGTGDVAGTMMACPDNTKIQQVVYAQSLLISYNSKLPIVVYVPVNMEVSYRIWKAEKKLKKAGL